MPRTHKRKLGARAYKDYTPDQIAEALTEIKEGIMSIREASRAYKIPRGTLANKLKEKHQSTAGGQTVLSEKDEADIIKHILACADWGMPLDSVDVRIIVKQHLQSCGRQVKKFTNNMPGNTWYYNFIKRHKDELTIRKCQNIKRARASIGIEEVTSYFDHLQTSLECIPPQNILNYDETNCSDEPGSKKCVFRRGVKYPERNLNSSKGCISLVFAATAEGTLLSSYIVYKAEHLRSTWVSGGPAGTRYGRTKSGWFDSPNFEEWFLQIVIPWARRLSGPKCIIGDSLSSHLSFNVIRECERLDIRFVFLPPNATHLCQPLDVAFFGPMKKAWILILTDYKEKNPSSSSLEKHRFPLLLKRLLDKLGIHSPDNIKAWFKACGIFPLDRQEVVKKLPHACGRNVTPSEVIGSPVSDTLLNYLKACGGGGERKQQVKRLKITLPPGKSVNVLDLTEDQHTEKNATDVQMPSTSATTSSSEARIGSSIIPAAKRKSKATTQRADSSSNESLTELQLDDSSSTGATTDSSSVSDVDNASSDRALSVHGSSECAECESGLDEAESSRFSMPKPGCFEEEQFLLVLSLALRKL